MKRLLAQIGITFYAVLAVAFYLNDSIIIGSAAAAAVASIVFFAVKKLRKTIFIPAIALTVLCACLVNLGYTSFYVRPITHRYAGEKRHVSATLSEEPYKAYSKYYYRLTTDTIDGEPVKTKLLFKTARPLDMDLYDRIDLTADISKNENQYYLSKQYYLTIDSYDVQYQITEIEEKPILYHAAELRRNLSDALDDMLSHDEAALCKAIFLGDKYAMSLSDRDNFRYSGVSYFIVVSGMHFSILLLGLWWLLKKLIRNRVAVLLLIVPVMLLYIGITGLQPSVVRAGIMAFILLLGRTGFRQTDPLNSLGLAGLLMPLIFSPYGCGDIGLILSFFATMGILLWVDPIQKKISFSQPDRLPKRIWNTIASLLSVSLAANILVFPITVFTFRAFSVVTLIASLILYPMIYLILVLSIVMCALYYLWILRYVAIVLSWVLSGICKAVLWLVEWLGSLPLSYLHAGPAFMIWLAIAFILLMTAYLLRKRFRFLKLAALISTALFIVIMAVHTMTAMNTYELTAYQTKSGVAVTYVHNDKVTMLGFSADSAAAYDILSDINDRYGKIDTAVCVTNKEYHNYSRITQRKFAIVHYLLYDKISDPIMDNDKDHFSCETVVRLDDGASLSVIPGKTNALRLLSSEGHSVLLIPERYPSDQIPPELKRADIVVAARQADIPDDLTCRTLIVCEKKIDQPIPADAETILYTADGDITVSLR